MNERKSEVRLRMQARWRQVVASTAGRSNAQDAALTTRASRAGGGVHSPLSAATTCSERS